MRDIPSRFGGLKLLFLLLFAFLLIPACQFSDEDPLASIEIHPDFQIELVAREPLTFDPVDLEFDEQGRAFVIEMPGYPFPDEGSRVVLLEDTDADGSFDKRTIFARDLSSGTTILPYRGGLLVGAPPDILFLKDTNGDNVADVRERLLGGFALENSQHNFNGLTYGLDNWIYGANGGNDGKVFWVDNPADTIPLREADFRFRLEEGKFERIGKTVWGFGLSFDSWGRIYTTSSVDHIHTIVFPGRYIEGLPLTPLSTTWKNSDHEEGGLARIYPIGAQETRVNHPEQSGYFSGACGIVSYTGGAFPEAFNENTFVCDVVLNLVHRDIIKLEGVSPLASRAREKVEFLASSDRGFRPVGMTIGPDGAIYLLDMHRTVIEHPEWIPDEIEKNLDLDAGKTEGRIYRITPKSGLPQVTPSFPRNDIATVVNHLAHKNKWWRDTAQRLLVDWQDTTAVVPLENLLRRHENPLARLHALWTLVGLNALSEKNLIGALSDPSAGVREHALKIAEMRMSDDDRLLAAVLNRATDNAPRVRMQTALTLGTLPARRARIAVREALLNIASRDVDDRWIRLAVLSGARQSPEVLLTEILKYPKDWQSDGATQLIIDLTQMVGHQQSGREVANLLSLSSKNKHLNNSQMKIVLASLSEGINGRDAPPAIRGVSASINRSLYALERRNNLSLTCAAWQIRDALRMKPSGNQRRLLRSAWRVVSDPSAGAAQRLESLELLSFAEYQDRADLLFALLDSRTPGDLQWAAMTQLVDAGTPGIAERVISVWKTLGPDVREKAGDFLLYRPENHDLLLTALEKGEITLGELYLHLERRRTLLRSEDENIRKRAEALFSDAGVVTRKEAIEQMRPALSLTGDAEHGMAVFKTLCARCHQVGDVGSNVGPNLTEINRKSPETLLFEILDPNAVMEIQYISHTIKTTEGEILTGLIDSETDDAVVLLNADEVRQRVSRSKIAAMSSSGLSLMPEELEIGMDHQAMADLLAFLQRR